MAGDSSGEQRKSNLDLVNACDQVRSYSQNLYRFLIIGFDTPFGHLQESIVTQFSFNQWPDDWSIDHNNRTVTLLARTRDDRDHILHQTLTHERNHATFKFLTKWSNEKIPIYSSNKELVLSIEKVAAPLFGILTYGVQMLGYHDHAEGPKLWIARRAKTKRTFPGMLDSTVGGSLTTGETPFECLVREAEEEASFPPQLTRRLARSVGAVSYIMRTDERFGGEIGCLCPEVQYCYEMKLEEDVTPVPGDNEVETFVLMDVEQVRAALAKGEFTPANACIVLDFFIRHGIITMENEPDHVEIVSRLHRRLTV